MLCCHEPRGSQNAAAAHSVAMCGAKYKIITFTPQVAPCDGRLECWSRLHSPLTTALPSTAPVHAAHRRNPSATCGRKFYMKNILPQVAPPPVRLRRRCVVGRTGVDAAKMLRRNADSDASVAESGAPCCSAATARLCALGRNTWPSGTVISEQLLKGRPCPERVSRLDGRI